MASSTVQELLVIFAFIAFLFWYLTFLWNRRNLYIYSRKVPGPFSVPLIGSVYMFLTDLSPSGVLNTLINIAKRYPGLYKFWFGPHLIYFLAEPKHIEKVLTNKHALHKNYVYDIIADAVGTGIFTAPVPKWRRHRKIIERIFSQKFLNSYVNVFVKQANIFSYQLNQYIGKNINTHVLVSRLTLETTCENLLGYTMDAQATTNGLTKLFDRIFEIITLRICSIWHTPKITFKLSPLNKEMDELVKMGHQIFNTIIGKKIKEHKLKKTLTAPEFEEEFDGQIKPFLEMAIEDSYFTDDDLRNEVKILVIAASDTTTNTLTFLFEVLGLYQDVQQKVYEEVIEVLGEVRDVESSDLYQLKYMEMVIKETLRLFPPAPLFFRKLGEDIDLGEAILPKGASVAVSPFNIHRRANLWPDPLKFDPDRFLSERVRNRHPCAYIPFSYGPRNCIGSQYGMMNVKTIVATVIRKYKFFTAYKSIEDIKTKLTITLRMEEGSKISATLRKPA